jgi:hypothetical protein
MSLKAELFVGMGVSLRKKVNLINNSGKSKIVISVKNLKVIKR